MNSKGFTLIEVMVVIVIVTILAAIIVGASEDVVTVDDDETIDTSVYEVLETVTTTNDDSVNQKCIDGIVYLLVTENGKYYMAPKENRYGDNERCSE